MATHSSALACNIPQREEPGKLTVHGVTKSQTRLSIHAHTRTIILPLSCRVPFTMLYFDIHHHIYLRLSLLLFLISVPSNPAECFLLRNASPIHHIQKSKVFKYFMMAFDMLSWQLWSRAIYLGTSMIKINCLSIKSALPTYPCGVEVGCGCKWDERAMWSEFWQKLDWIQLNTSTKFWYVDQWLLTSSISPVFLWIFMLSMRIFTSRPPPPQQKHGCPLIHLLFRVAHGQEQSSYDIELYLSISISVSISIYCLKSLKQLQFGPIQEEEKVADLAHKIWGKAHAATKIEMSPN